ncbi:hypothetical protein GQ53DRAFT_767498 [Thozetella sp. PMI_491]|nr:hypothetical protein GQ53DRAFT_767498 [Thozetella sp. PMI_491]
MPGLRRGLEILSKLLSSPVFKSTTCIGRTNRRKTLSFGKHIIVSIGTGIFQDISGQVSPKDGAHAKNLRRILPQGLRKRVEVGLDMIKATLNCHREWLAFTSSLDGKAMTRNCHRLDVGLVDKPPSLDDLQKLLILQEECEDYLKPGMKELCNQVYASRCSTAVFHRSRLEPER